MKTILKILAFILLTITLTSCAVQEELAYGHYYPRTHYVIYDNFQPYHYRTVVKVTNKPHHSKKQYHKPHHSKKQYHKPNTNKPYQRQQQIHLQNRRK